MIYLEITYGADEASTYLYDLIEYANNNYTGDLKDHKSIKKILFFLIMEL